VGVVVYPTHETVGGEPLTLFLDEHVGLAGVIDIGHASGIGIGGHDPLLEAEAPTRCQMGAARNR